MPPNTARAVRIVTPTAGQKIFLAVPSSLPIEPDVFPVYAFAITRIKAMLNQNPTALSSNATRRKERNERPIVPSDAPGAK